MAEDNRLEILLEATDNATGEINRVKGALADVEKSTQQVSRTTTEAGKNIRQQFKEAGSELRDFRRTMFLVTIAMATVIATTREAAKYNKESAKTFSDFTIAATSLSVTIGQILSPALEGLTSIIKTLRDTVEAMASGFIKAFSFVAEFFSNLGQGPVAAYKRAIEVANIATDQFLNKIEETRANVEKGWTLDKIKQQTDNIGKIAEDTAAKVKKVYENIATGMSQSFGNVLGKFAVEGGKFKDAMIGYFKDMAQQFIAQVTAMIAKWLIFMALKAIGSFFGLHEGGEVPSGGGQKKVTVMPWHSGGVIRAHSGLALDEVPAILQTGEGVLSRRGMSMLGGAGMLNALNSGSGGRQTTISIQVNYPTVRSDEDISRLTEEISQRFAREAERL